MIRIQSGILKGRNLPHPDPKEARPTTQKVRSAIFNILQKDLSGAFVWDLFAGSGAVGLEAYSRGASQVLFLDKNPLLMTGLSQWISRQIPDHRDAFSFFSEDVLRFLVRVKPKKPPSIIFMDPPYHYPDWSRLLNALCDGDIVDSNSLMVLEYHRKDSLPWESLLDRGYQVLSHHTYGESGVSLLVPAAR